MNPSQKSFLKLLHDEVVPMAKRHWGHPLFRDLAKWPQKHLEPDSKTEISEKFFGTLDSLLHVIKSFPKEINRSKPDRKTKQLNLSTKVAKYLCDLEKSTTVFYSANEYFCPDKDFDDAELKVIGPLGNTALKCALVRFRNQLRFLQDAWKDSYGLEPCKDYERFRGSLIELSNNVKQLEAYTRGSEARRIAVAMSWVQIKLVSVPEAELRWLGFTSKVLEKSRNWLLNNLAPNNVDLDKLSQETSFLANYLSENSQGLEDRIKAIALSEGKMVIDVKAREISGGDIPKKINLSEDTTLFYIFLALCRKAENNAPLQYKDHPSEGVLNPKEALATSICRLRAMLPKDLIKTVRNVGYKLECEHDQFLINE